ncbi:hypothetical protein KC866_01835 [Patescibacteria group bacterium]|nr:hypothetical protein [Patescibacteria group bacterium]
MNDPLRDNRIFPEEMHEAPVRKEPLHHTHFWTWFTFSAIFILLLLWLAFSFFGTDLKTVFNPPSPEEVEYQQQVAVFETLNADRPLMTADERADKINKLFGTQ